MKDTLYLPLKKEWYEMIESGVKTEEYREVKPYWEKRLLDYEGIKRDLESSMLKHLLFGRQIDVKEYKRGFILVQFSYGYTKRTMTFEVKSIRIGRGNPKWGAPADKEVFIIELGRRVK